MASSAEPQKAFAEKLQHEFSDLLKLALTASEEVYYPPWKTMALKGHEGSIEGDYAGLRVYPMGQCKVLVVAVVGTITLEQWISNFTLSPAEDGFHQEFKRCAEEFWSELVGLQLPSISSAKLWFTKGPRPLSRKSSA